MAKKRKFVVEDENGKVRARPEGTPEGTVIAKRMVNEYEAYSAFVYRVEPDGTKVQTFAASRGFLPGNPE